MLTIREEILKHIEKNRMMTAGQLSSTLGVTSTDIRYHLRALLAEHKIEQVHPNATGQRNRGRPVNFFRLADMGASPALLRLVDGLLTAQQKSVMTTDAQIARFVVPDLPTTGKLTHRLNAMTNSLTSAGYQARWEAHAQGPQVILANCPFASLISQHPELCRMDSNLLSVGSGFEVEQISRIDFVHFQPSECRFRFNLERAIPDELHKNQG